MPFPLERELRDGRTVLLRQAEPEDAAAVIAYVHRTSGESDNLTFGEGEFEVTEEAEVGILTKFRDTDNWLYILALVDGDLLNADFNLYLQTVGERQKTIGLGTYGDGADRRRPMLIFANPLGATELDRHVNLIHRSPLLDSETEDLRKVYEIRRTAKAGLAEAFSCYRFYGDTPDHTQCELLVDPFPTPEREQRTRPRGKFVLPFQMTSD